MCAFYNPPTEDISSFNTSLFNQPEDTLSQAEADLLYLSKTKTDTSTAPLTTFNGQLAVNGVASFPVSIISGTNGAGGITAKGGIIFNNINSPYTDTYCQVYPTNNVMNFIMDAGTTTASFHYFYVRNNAYLQRISVKVGYDAVEILNGANLNAKADIVCFDKNSPNTNTLTINQNVANASYTAFAGATTATTHTFTTYTNANAPKNSLVVTSSGATILEGLALQTRIITSTATTSTAHQLFNNMGSGAVLTIGNVLSSNTINGNTTLTNLLTLNNNLKFNDTMSPFTNNSQISQDALLFNIKNNMTNGSIVLKALNSGGTTKSSLTISGASVDVLDELPLKVRQIQSSSTAAVHTLFDNMTTGATLSIGNALSTNTINGNTTLPNTTTFGANTTISQSGSTSTINQTSSTGTLEFITRQGGIPSTPLTLTSTLITLNSGTRINSSLDLWDSGTLTKNANLEVLTVSGDFSISNSNNGGNIVLETTDGSGLTQPVTINSTETSIATKIKLTGTTYNVAFPSQQNLGYYLRQVSSAFTTLTTNTYKTIYTTATQLGMGVWRIDWSVKNTITTGGSITQSQAFISTTSVDTNTPLVNTGAILRTHVTETYAINDIQIVASSFTLTLAVATSLYLTILKTFATGAYSYIGEISATRIA
jgi:hypothetical protein